LQGWNRYLVENKIPNGKITVGAYMPTHTKFFPGYLESLMRKHGISQVELNKLTGIAVSRINNYLKGKYRTVTPEHLEAIVLAVSGDQLERSELLKIYLLDLLTETLRPMVEINPLSQPKSFDNWFFEMDRLPREFTEQFKELYKLCIASPRVRDRTGTWIKIMQETVHAKESKPPFSSHIRKIQSVTNSPFAAASGG
jgi:transcriptional regulator with XRE-family HTH domain